MEQGGLQGEAVVVPSAAAPFAELRQEQIEPSVEGLEADLVEQLPRRLLRHGVPERAERLLRVVHHPRVVGILLFQQVWLRPRGEMPLLRYRFVVQLDDATLGYCLAVFVGKCQSALP